MTTARRRRPAVGRAMTSEREEAEAVDERSDERACAK